MVTCDTCGTEGQFRVVSGFYYCKICDTQSQHAVEEEIELAFEENDLFTQGRAVAGRSKRGELSTRFRVYRRLNLYNDLLRKQVDELSHLGAPPRFKIAVMELWFKYIDVLELDCEPYGKLPPFCLREELEMASKKLNEESFSLKKAVYHHVPMRTSTQRMQTLGKRWCRSHPLYGYNIPKAPRIERLGLSEIMSDLSTIDRDRSNTSMSSASESVGTDLENETMNDAAEFSGFGFGSQNTTLVEDSSVTENITTQSMLIDDDDDANEDFGSFSFAINSQETPVSNPANQSIDDQNEEPNDVAEQKTTDLSQHIAGSSIEEVDLTSKIAYKLRAHMEARDILSIEKYVETVLQMRCSCLIMILYLALIRAKVNHIGVVDLYRFVRQGHLTYREAREVASEELLKVRRNIFYHMNLPEIFPQNIAHGAFLKSCAILCGLLNIQDLQLPDLNFYIAKIALDLNLPRDIIAFATTISSRFSLQPSWSLKGHEEFPHLRVPSLPHIELEACAAIVLTLKYLFGLDGREEYKLSMIAELESAEEQTNYFVISHWLTQLSQRAHFLRRRGEFFNAHPLEFEHIKSSAHLIRHDARRRTDFYYRGVNFRRCQRFLDDLSIPSKVHVEKLPPTSFPMRGSLEELLKQENSSDSLSLLKDMTRLKVYPGNGTPRPYQQASTRHSKFFKQTRLRDRIPIKDSSDGNRLAPSANLLTLIELLAEYCLSSAIMLHWALMRIERQVFDKQAGNEGSRRRMRNLS